MSCCSRRCWCSNRSLCCRSRSYSRVFSSSLVCKNRKPARRIDTVRNKSLREPKKVSVRLRDARATDLEQLDGAAEVLSRVFKVFDRGLVLIELSFLLAELLLYLGHRVGLDPVRLHQFVVQLCHLQTAVRAG